MGNLEKFVRAVAADKKNGWDTAKTFLFEMNIKNSVIQHILITAVKEELDKSSTLDIFTTDDIKTFYNRILLEGQFPLRYIVNKDEGELEAFVKQLVWISPLKQHALLERLKAEKNNPQNTNRFFSKLLNEVAEDMLTRKAEVFKEVTTEFNNRISKVLITQEEHEKAAEGIREFLNLQLGQKHKDIFMLYYAMCNTCIAENSEKALEIFINYSANPDKFQQTLLEKASLEILIFLLQPHSQQENATLLQEFFKVRKINDLEWKLLSAFIKEKRIEDAKLATVRNTYTLEHLRTEVRKEKMAAEFKKVIAKKDNDESGKILTAFLNWQTGSIFPSKKHPLYYYILNKGVTEENIKESIAQYQNSGNQQQLEDRASLEELVFLLRSQKNAPEKREASLDTFLRDQKNLDDLYDNKYYSKKRREALERMLTQLDDAGIDKLSKFPTLKAFVGYFCEQATGDAQKNPTKQQIQNFLEGFCKEENPSLEAFVIRQNLLKQSDLEALISILQPDPKLNNTELSVHIFCENHQITFLEWELLSAFIEEKRIEDATLATVRNTYTLEQLRTEVREEKMREALAQVPTLYKGDIFTGIGHFLEWQLGKEDHFVLLHSMGNAFLVGDHTKALEIFTNYRKNPADLLKTTPEPTNLEKLVFLLRSQKNAPEKRKASLDTFLKDPKNVDDLYDDKYYSPKRREALESMLTQLDDAGIDKLSEFTTLKAFVEHFCKLAIKEEYVVRNNNTVKKNNPTLQEVNQFVRDFNKATSDLQALTTPQNSSGTVASANSSAGKDALDKGKRSSLKRRSSLLQ